MISGHFLARTYEMLCQLEVIPCVHEGISQASQCIIEIAKQENCNHLFATQVSLLTNKQTKRPY